MLKYCFKLLSKLSVMRLTLYVVFHSGKSSVMSWPDVKLIPQTNKNVIFYVNVVKTDMQAAVGDS